MTYEDKHQDIKNLMDTLAKMCGGPGPGSGKCALCGSDKVGHRKHFTDELSYQEWLISKMCQVCQNSVFTEDEE